MLNNIDIICEWTERKWSADVILNAENVLIFHVLLNQCSLKATVICVDHMNCFFFTQDNYISKFCLAKVKKWLSILWYNTTCIWFHSRHGLTWTQCKITISVEFYNKVLNYFLMLYMYMTNKRQCNKEMPSRCFTKLATIFLNWSLLFMKSMFYSIFYYIALAKIYSTWTCNFFPRMKPNH